MKLFDPILKKRFFAICDQIKIGHLELHTPDRTTHTFGDPSAAPEDRAVMVVEDWRTLSAMVLRGDIGLGEAYMRRWWDTPDLDQLIRVALKNGNLVRGVFGGALMQRILFRLSDIILRDNSRKGSKKNISAHYDLGNEFYTQWLDPSMTYSGALYDGEKTSLEQAQHAKYDRLLCALGDTGPSTLEIGCGWGGFAERAAEHSGRNVTGVTISQEQFDFAKKRLGDRADIRLQDYRDIDGKFDAIVSIEMIEAVGERHWPTYFNTIKNRLAQGGRAAIQAIVVSDDWFAHYRERSDFIRRYTFPGGMLISPGQITKHARENGLEATNFFHFGKDYARTLREWTQKFTSAEAGLRRDGYDDEFLRGWRFYLESCAASFDVSGRTDLVQVELAHA